MMSVTHSAIALSGTSLILGTTDPLALGLAIIGSQLPDLDTTTSTIGKICFPISSWIEDRFPHRSITHCLLATAAIAVWSIPLGFFSGEIKAAIALPLGHLLSCFSDTFTKQGVQLFYPEPVWAISVSNPRRRLKTGGAGELWVLGIAIALRCFGIYLANGGGISQKVSQSLGLKDGVIELYNQNASTHQVYANITGVWASDRTSADGKYLIIGNEANEFVVSDGKGVYKTGEQIITSKVSTTVGEAAKTEIKSISFDDEDAIAQLQELQQTYPGAEIYLNGELTVDFPEDVKIPVEPNQSEVADTMRAPFVLGNTKVLQSLFTDAGVSNAQIMTHEGTARFPSINSWVYTEIKGWTLADMIDDAQYQRLLQEAEKELRQFVTPEGTVAFRLPAHIVTATKV